MVISQSLKNIRNGITTNILREHHYTQERVRQLQQVEASNDAVIATSIASRIAMSQMWMTQMLPLASQTKLTNHWTTWISTYVMKKPYKEARPTPALQAQRLNYVCILVQPQNPRTHWKLKLMYTKE